MPGKPISVHQVARYMVLRQDGVPQLDAAARVAISVRSARRVERDGHASAKPVRTWRTRADAFADVWASEVEPLLCGDGRLKAYALWEEMRRRHPDRWLDGQRRSFERRVSQWKAQRGPEREVMFPQEHLPGREAVFDFTVADELSVTIAGAAFPHRLAHLRLPFSGFAHVAVILGGESFPALAESVVAAFDALGGTPQVLRTDSLSAAFRNLGLKQVEDLTARYRQLCGHYGVQPQRCTPGRGHENGAVESPHGHLKDRLDQVLRLRGTRDFTDLGAYRGFVSDLVAQGNARRAGAIATERSALSSLPSTRPVTWNEAFAVASSLCLVRVLGVSYTVPSRLIHRRLSVRVFDDRLEFVCGSAVVHAAARSHASGVSRSIDYHCVIDSLVRKPGAFPRLVYRDQLHPRPVFQAAWERLRATAGDQAASRAYLRLLHAAHRHACEDRIAAALAPLIADPGAAIEVDALIARVSPPPAAAVPALALTPVDPASYDALFAIPIAPDAISLQDAIPA